jgi:hypothetical protein
MKTTVLTPPVEPLATSPSYGAYVALMAHLRACDGCAHAIRPCAAGTALRRAWKAARA